MGELKFQKLTPTQEADLSGYEDAFYKLFGSKENILLFKLDHSPYADQDAEDETEIITLMDTCTRFSQYVTANYDQLQMLLENDLMEVVYTQMYTSMSTCRRSFVSVTEEEREYAAQFMSAGLCRLTQKYIREHNKPSQDELTQLSYKIMSGHIYRL